MSTAGVSMGPVDFSVFFFFKYLLEEKVAQDPREGKEL